MTPAQGEADFDETVFDTPAGDPAPVETPKAADPAPVADDEPQAATPVSQIEETARKAGWSGKDDWKGDPADWLEAPEFILKAVGDVLPSMRKSLEDAKGEIAGLKKAVKTSIDHLSKAEERAYAKAMTDIQARIDQAAAIGDVAGVREATD